MRNVRVRAFLLVSLNAVAVPACQHFEGDGSTRRGDTQALARPAPAVPAAIPSDPRLPPPRA